MLFPIVVLPDSSLHEAENDISLRWNVSENQRIMFLRKE